MLVGGAVRDCLRGLPLADWDLATSATPDEVIEAFPRTIPTGLAHGTVTVLVGHGKARQHVEVTTFRGDGDYADGRRPESVRFLRNLEEDLARRDFTINALAWDPFTERFVDRFDGLGDLRRGVVRAVGEPLARFREDGLRTMRAVRFCAVLGFALEPATEAAIPQALDVFDKVSRERVRVELVKLLAATRTRPGLDPMWRTELWPRVLVPLAHQHIASTIAAVDALRPDPMLRLARLMWPRRSEDAVLATSLDNLRLSRAERRRCNTLTRSELAELGQLRDAAAVRRIVAAIGVDHLDDALAIVEASPEQHARVHAACADAILDPKSLAVGARDLISVVGVAPGPLLGELLAQLFEFVLRDPSNNTAPRLLAEARRRHGASR